MKKQFTLVFLIFICLNSFSQEKVAYYPFNENANDESGNGYNGEIFNSLPTEDRFNKSNSAFLFGNNKYIKVLNGNNMNVFTNSISISCWVKPIEQNGVNAILAKWPVEQSKDHFGIWLSNMKPVLGIGHPSVSVPGITFNYTLESNEWYFLTFTWSTGIHKLYVNGVFIEEIDNQNYSKISESSDAELFIGNDGQNRYFEGKIDEVAIFKNELTLSEVQNLYDTSLNINENKLNDIKIMFLNGKIELSDKEYFLNIYDSLGKKIQNENLSKGLYILKISNGRNNLVKKLLLK
ncbi:LamG-like jellyroll fold domain-containing protein [Polaribacter sargassicola]|uniref:LamG-like jellyroll fold domain-containing protein n=1 Tax=Polaribacter sargassicola TaxID=2836891 RepID=UPI001F210E97|nr:LamG-like jellyroll fold domain-containing protein [Polaribacter sp. DS7-9]MCG1036256.1 hypothetical protein [Polaribacter sp. DS7-9]